MSAYSLFPLPRGSLPACAVTAGRLKRHSGRPAFSHTFGAFAARRFTTIPSKTNLVASPSDVKLSNEAAA